MRVEPDAKPGMTAAQEQGNTDQEQGRPKAQEAFSPGQRVSGEAPARTVEQSQQRSRKGEEAGPAYYDIPMLKPPVWKWDIATYFFLGGLSAGAFTLARMADRFGGNRYTDLTRTGTKVAALAVVPCPLLLINDLGDKKRFHHMLRVFKPTSPMNLGSWALTKYSGVVALALIREWHRERQRVGGPGLPLGGAVRRATPPLADLGGIPLALTMCGYTGNLLSTSNIPIWSRNAWLAPLFTAAAFSAGASAIDLAMELEREGGGRGRESPSKEPLKKVESAARLTEAATLAGYLTAAGKHAEPLTQGKYAPLLWGGAVGLGLVAPPLLERAPAKSGRARRWKKLAKPALTLLGGLALRFAIVYAGHDSAKDPQQAREFTRRETAEAAAKDEPARQ